MLKTQYLEGRTVKTKQITFEELTETIKSLLTNCKEVKTLIQIPSTKGFNLMQSKKWNKESIKTNMFNNNLIISDESSNDGLAINKDCNLLIIKHGHSTVISFEDYHIQLVFNH